MTNSSVLSWPTSARHPVPIDDLGATTAGWETYEAAVESHVGPSGFILFGLFNHGGWIKNAGIDRKVLRIIIGNPTDRDHDAPP